MNDFQRGLEAAARFVEEEHGAVRGGEMAALLEGIRSIADPEAGRDMVAMNSAVPAQQEAFEQFKAAYIQTGGFRNPKSLAAVAGWAPARKKFDLLVKKLGVDAAQIVAGTIAYARTRPEKQYVPAPEVFLNKRQFAYDWAHSGARRGPSPSDVEAFLQGQVDGE